MQSNAAFKRAAGGPGPKLSRLPMAETRSDEALMAAIATGDQLAFARLVERHLARTVGLATRLMGSRADGEEVAQEALVEVWRSAARFDASKGSATSWVLTITHRRAVDRVRSAQSGADRERRAEQRVGRVRDLDEREPTAPVLAEERRRRAREERPVLDHVPGLAGALARPAEAEDVDAVDAVAVALGAVRTPAAHDPRPERIEDRSRAPDDGRQAGRPVSGRAAGQAHPRRRWDVQLPRVQHLLRALQPRHERVLRGRDDVERALGLAGRGGASAVRRPRIHASPVLKYSSLALSQSVASVM